VLERFAGLGLTDAWVAAHQAMVAPDCDCADEPCRHVRTHTHRRSVRPWQLDYVFTNATWDVDAITTAIDEHTWSRSDHAPVVVSLRQGGRP
jgi:endonuclease/exonuclease/phosphatase family metal-dependent hydrolase